MPVKKATTIIIIESDISIHEIIIEFYDKLYIFPLKQYLQNNLRPT